eukprot:1374809-Rhodomonas_salina.1
MLTSTNARLTNHQPSAGAQPPAGIAMYTLATLLQAYSAGVEDSHTPQSSTGQNAQPFGQHAPRDKGKPECRSLRKD